MTTLPPIRKRKLDGWMEMPEMPPPRPLSDIERDYRESHERIIKKVKDVSRMTRMIVERELENLRAERTSTPAPATPVASPSPPPPPPPLSRQPSNDGVDASVLVELLVGMSHVHDLKPLVEAAARGEVSLRELRLRLQEILIFRPSAPGFLQLVWNQARATTAERHSRAQKELEEVIDRESRGLWDDQWSYRQDNLLVAWVQAHGRGQVETEWKTCARTINEAKVGSKHLSGNDCKVRMRALTKKKFPGAVDACRQVQKRYQEELEKARAAADAAEEAAEEQRKRDAKKPKSDNDVDFHFAMAEVASRIAAGEPIPEHLQHLVDDDA